MVANLFNFAINSDRTPPDHDLFLGNVVAPLVVANAAAGARIIGLASRSGSATHNLALSRRRARSVEVSLSLFLFANDLVNPAGPASANLGRRPGRTVRSQPECEGRQRGFAVPRGPGDGPADRTKNLRAAVAVGTFRADPNASLAKQHRVGRGARRAQARNAPSVRSESDPCTTSSTGNSGSRLRTMP